MVIKQLFQFVRDRHGLDPARVVWVAYNSERPDVAAGRIGGWERLTWEGGPGRKPKWQQMTADDWTELGVVPPPPAPGVCW